MSELEVFLRDLFQCFVPEQGKINRDGKKKVKRERERLKVHSETWPRLEPGTCPYMHNRLS